MFRPGHRWWERHGGSVLRHDQTLTLDSWPSDCLTTIDLFMAHVPIKRRKFTQPSHDRTLSRTFHATHLGGGAMARDCGRWSPARVVEIYGAIHYLFIPNADVLKVRVFSWSRNRASGAAWSMRWCDPFFPRRRQRKRSEDDPNARPPIRRAECFRHALEATIRVDHKPTVDEADIEQESIVRL